MKKKSQTGQLIGPPNFHHFLGNLNLWKFNPKDIYVHADYIFRMNDSNFNQNSGITGGTSKEVIYLIHVLDTLKSAQQSFDTGDVQRFNLYVTYLENAVLDSAVRKKINAEKITEEKRLKALNIYDERGIEFRVAFIVVREVFSYLNNVMELETENIMGAVGIDEDIEPIEKMDITEKEEYNLYEDDPLSQYPDYPEEDVE